MPALEDLEQHRRDAFERLAALVAEWTSTSRIPTSAGIKSAMMKDEGFSESDLGFSSYKDFLEAAQQGGYIEATKIGGHTHLHPPGQPPPAARAEGSGRERTGPATGTGIRLKSDVWTCFVDWNTEYRRYWDRNAGRAFMFPLDHEGRPVWETQPDRVVSIPPASLDVQLDWMTEFVDEQLPDVAEALRPTVGHSAPRGAFRRELQLLNLQDVWRERLQRRVTEYVLDWARENDVAPRQLVHSPAPRSQAPAGGTSPAAHVPEGAPASGHSTNASRAAGTVADGAGDTGGSARHRATQPAVGTTRSSQTSATELEKLRERMHRIVDRMSLAELAALPVRLEHFVD